jgi:hypothetical protein
MTTPDESVFKIDAEVQRRYDHYSQVANISRTYSTRRFRLFQWSRIN